MDLKGLDKVAKNEATTLRASLVAGPGPASSSRGSTPVKPSKVGLTAASPDEDPKFSAALQSFVELKKGTHQK